MRRRYTPFPGAGKGLKCQQHLAPVDAAVQDEHIVRGLRLLLDERRLSRLAGPIDLMAGLL